MAQLLRQGTSVAVHIGPALTTGGVAVQTAITTTGTAKRIFKHLATAAVTVTGAITHIAVGHYRMTLGTGHTGTLGHFTLAITATAGTNKALPMWQKYMVVPANVFDSLVSGTDRLQVDATQWAGSSTATGDTALKNTLAKGTDLTGFNDITATGVWAVAARTLTSGGTVADSVWVETIRTLTSAGVAWSAGTRSLTDKAGFSLTTGQHDSIVDKVWNELASGHSTASSYGTRLDAKVSTRSSHSAADVWAAGTRTLTAFAFTVSAVVTNKTGYTLTSAQHDAIGLRAWTASNGRTLTAFAFTVSAVVTNKTGYTLTSAQHDAIGARTWAQTARTLTSGGNVASSVWGRSISDVTGAPAGSAAAAGTRLAFLYVGARYKRTTTATGDKLFSSASVGIAKAPVSRTSTVFTRGKFATVTG